MNEMLMRQRDNMVPKQKRESYGPKGGQLSAEISGRIQKQRGSGKPLSAEMLRSYSEHFKRNMKDVRVHDDMESAELNEHLNSRAFTVGNDIFLDQHTDMNDREVMTHELTHVAQNGGKAPAGSLTLGAVDTPQEHEASAGTARSSAPSGTVQRWGFFKKIKKWFSNLFGGKKNNSNAPAAATALPNTNLASRGVSLDNKNTAGDAVPAMPNDRISDGWEVIDEPISTDIKEMDEAPSREDDMDLIGALDSMNPSSPLIDSDPNSSKLIEDENPSSIDQIDKNFDLNMEAVEVPGFKGELFPEGMIGGGLGSGNIGINIEYGKVVSKNISELKKRLSVLDKKDPKEDYSIYDLSELEEIQRQLENLREGFKEYSFQLEPGQEKKVETAISSLMSKAKKLRKKIEKDISPDLFI